MIDSPTAAWSQDPHDRGEQQAIARRLPGWLTNGGALALVAWAWMAQSFLLTDRALL